MEKRDKWYFDYCQKVHKKKLKEIKSSFFGKFEQYSPSYESLVDIRMKGLSTKRNNDIRQLGIENNLILTRIVNITNRPNNRLIKLNPLTKSVKNKRKIAVSAIPPLGSKLQREKDYELAVKLKSIVEKKRNFFNTQVKDFQVKSSVTSILETNESNPVSPKQDPNPLPSVIRDQSSKNSYIKVVSPTS